MAVRTFIVKRDCYWNGLFLKKGQTIQVSGEVTFDLLEEVVQRPVGEVPVHVTDIGAKVPTSEDVAEGTGEVPKKATNKK